MSLTGWAQLYRRGEVFVVVPMARAEAGYRISVEPAERLPASVDNRELGAAVRRAYERPQPVVPTPDSNAARRRSRRSAPAARATSSS